MANNKKNAENKENLENLEQAEDNKENLEQAEDNTKQPKPNADSLAVEAKGFSESEEFKVGRAKPVENTDDTQVIIRF